MAPPMAAAVLDREPFTLDDLMAELQWPSPEPAVRWVETVGGPRSPIAFDGDSADVCDALDPDLVVLVADAGPRAPSTRSGSRWRPSTAISVVVVLNRFDPDDELHVLNRAWLTDRDQIEVVTSTAELRVAVLAASASDGRP